MYVLVLGFSDSPTMGVPDAGGRFGVNKRRNDFFTKTGWIFFLRKLDFFFNSAWTKTSPDRGTYESRGG